LLFALFFAIHQTKGCFMATTRRIALLICLGAAACAPQEQAEDLAATTADLATDTTPFSVTTVEDLMTDVVMPNAELLWKAVSYIATAEGVTETMPQTDEDWTTLRDSANALIEAGDELMNTNREILTSEFDAATARFQFTPEEIKQMLIDDPAPWQNYVQLLQETTRMTLQAIELRDVMGLQEFGAGINEACEGCHAAYWYRPAMPR
jgi:hypothetical protein